MSQNNSSTIIKHEIDSELWNSKRNISVFLPYEYQTQLNQEFPVIYLFDAQNTELFNLTTSILDYLILCGEFKPTIIVGIHSVNRQFEFTPINKTEKPLEVYEKVGGSKILTKYLENEIFPFINKEYRTNPIKIALGHSLGGTFITNYILDYPETFDGAVLVSPNYYYDGEAIINKLNSFDFSGLNRHKFIYLAHGDTGEYEEKFHSGISKAVKVLEKAKSENLSFKYSNIINENHATSIIPGFYQGLKSYHENTFLNAENLITHFEFLELETGLKLTADEINQLAYNCLYKNKIIDAEAVLKWALKKYPKDTNLNDSMGEILEKQKKFEKALSFYEKALYILENEDINKKLNDYKKKEEYYKRNIKRLNGQLERTPKKN